MQLSTHSHCIQNGDEKSAETWVSFNGIIQQMCQALNFHLFESIMPSGYPYEQKDEKIDMAVTFEKMQTVEKFYVL